jgi:hypothetical protein
MGLLTLIWLTLLKATGADADPAPGLFNSKAQSRAYECERLDIAEAHREHPGEVRAPGPRGEYIDRSALVCTEKLVRPGLRNEQDEAILASLDERASELGSLAGLRPDLSEKTWLVEAYYPNPQVASKVSFATKNALVSQGLLVSDRTPILGFGDMDVITRLPPEQAYAAACQRYSDNGSLGPDDALMGVVLLDPRETQLHAGVCANGSWSWVQ